MVACFFYIGIEKAAYTRCSGGDLLAIITFMHNWYWILIGLAVGAVCGAIFGIDYALAGAGIGLASGVGIWLVMRTRRR